MGLLRGIDVSGWNGPPAGWREAAGTFSFGAVKFTEAAPEPGGRATAYLNPDAHADWADLESQGKVRIAYMFGHPAVSSGASVGLFASALHDAGLKDGDAIALDLEVTDGLAPAAVNLWALRVLRELERLFDRPPLLYSFLSFIRAGNCASLGEFPLWLADPSAPAGRPQVPPPWKRWSIQQVRITSPLDRDVANYPDPDAMRAALGKPQPVPGHGHVVHWHLIGIRRSLAWEARRHRTTPATMLSLAREAGHHYGRAMAEYMARGDWSAPVPEGTLLFAPAR